MARAKPRQTDTPPAPCPSPPAEGGARVLFLLCRDFLLTKWTLRVPGTSITLLLFLAALSPPGVATRDGGAMPCSLPRSRRGLESWKEDRARGSSGTGVAVLSQACNARGHRSRNISCQAGSNGRRGWTTGHRLAPKCE